MEDTDSNRRFNQYGNYNFSSFDDGSRVKFNFCGYTLAGGLGVHF